MPFRLLKPRTLYCAVGLVCCLSTVVLMHSLMYSTVDSLFIPPRANSFGQSASNTQRRNTPTQRPVPAECDTCCYNFTPSSHIRSDFTLLSPAKRAERHCEKRLPQAIIIGAMKSGTYALRTFLSYHPDIAMAFDEASFWVGRKIVTEESLKDYKGRMHYSTPGQVTMEKTPDYYCNIDVPERIKKHLPNVKLIMIMRDPVKRAISHYNFRRLRNTDPDFPATFEQAVLIKGDGINERSYYVSWSVYHKFVSVWLEHFPRDRFLAIDGDPFLQDPLPQLQRIEKFLGVRPYFDKEYFVKNRTSDLWCLKRPIHTCVPQSEPHPPHPNVSHEVRQKLYKYFKPFNQELAKLLKEPIFEWFSH